MSNWIIAIFVVLCVLYFLGRDNTSNNSSTSRPTRIPQHKPSRNKSRPTFKSSSVPLSVQIKKLHDNDDVDAVFSPQQRKLISDVNNYQREKKKVLRTIQASNDMEIISFDFSWSENLSELMEVTEVLYTNNQMNCNRRLESARFQYYINLHFRSFVAADLCYAKKEEMLPCYNQVNFTLKRLNDRLDPLRVSEQDHSQILKIKDSMKSIIAFLKARVGALNEQTAILRDKIRDECGTGGRKWYESLMERRYR